MARIHKKILIKLRSYALRGLRAGGWIYALACRLITVGEIVGMIALWVLYFKSHETLERSKNKDPLEAFGGHDIQKRNPSLTYECNLPSGESIQINNSNAVFIGDAENDGQTNKLFPTFASAIKTAREGHSKILPSAGLIHYRLKREDDRLIETLLLENHKLLIDVLRGMENELLTTTSQTGREAAAFVAGGQMLTSPMPTRVSAEVRMRAQQLVVEFKTGARSDALGRGFNDAGVEQRYRRSPELRRAFELQRYLMGALEPNTARILSDVLARKNDLRTKLERVVRAEAHWSNPPEVPHLLAPMESPGMPNGKVHFLPYAQSQENKYYAHKYGQNGMPEDEGWMNDIIAGVQTGRIEIQPRPDSGWMDYQFFALTPLVREDQSAALRTGKLHAMPAYRTYMEETFRAALTGLRETHILSVGPPPLGIGGGDSPGPLVLAPDFACEPEPSLYWRTAQAYHFLAQGLEAESAARQKVQQLELIARGITAVSVLELGLPPKALEGWHEEDTARLHDDAQRGRAWLKSLLDDPLLAEDPRLCFVAASDHHWGIAGVQLRRLRYDYEKNPIVEKKAGIERRPAFYEAPVLMAVEFANDIPAEDFAAFCGKYERVADCLEALGALDGSGKERPVPLAWALGILTTLVVVHCACWNRAITRRRQGLVKLPWRRRLRVQATWFCGLIVCYLYLPLWVVLFIIPRVDLPQRARALMCAYFATSFVRNARAVEYYAQGPFRLLQSIATPVSPCTLLINAAMRSNARAVREVALNSFHCDERYHIQYIDGLYDICRKRGYAEATLAFPFMTEDYEGKSFGHLREIYRHYADPSFIYMSAWAIIKYGSPEDLAELERAVQLGAKQFHTEGGTESKSSQPGSRIRLERECYLGSAVACLLENRPEILPYDRMVDFGFFPRNPDDGTSLTLKNWPINDQSVTSMFFLHQKRYGEDRLSSEQWRAVCEDLRPARLIVNCWRLQRLEDAVPGLLASLEYLNPHQQEYVLHWMGEALTMLPDSVIEEHVAREVIHALVIHFANASLRADDENSICINFLQQLNGSPWKDRPNPWYQQSGAAVLGDYRTIQYPYANISSCGEIFEILIGNLGKRSAGLH